MFMSIECGKIFSGGGVRKRRKRLKDHKRDKHNSFSVHAKKQDFCTQVDKYTSIFQKHNIHRIKIPDVKTTTLRSEALREDKKTVKKILTKNVTNDGHFQEHDLSFL